MANENQYYKTPFANSGTRETVPDDSVGGNVGYDTGYGPDYELAQGDPNRKRIPRGAHNELLYGVTKNVKQWQESNFPTWIEDDGTGSPFSYAKDAIVRRISKNWISTVDANTDEPGVGAKWSEFILGNLTSYVKNRWVGNQNFNVPGKDGYPLLDAVPQTITAGLEIAAGIIALTECQQMTKVGGIVNSGNNTGIIRRSYPKDPSGAITKNSQYGAIKNHLGEQVQAEVGSFGTGGVKISDDASNVYVDVDLSIVTNGIKFLILADEPGICEDVSDEISRKALGDDILLSSGVFVDADTITFSESTSSFKGLRFVIEVTNSLQYIQPFLIEQYIPISSLSIQNGVRIYDALSGSAFIVIEANSITSTDCVARIVGTTYAGTINEVWGVL